jgi:peptidoglycan hydrolase-like protein with peptidoglycan-binding domain
MADIETEYVALPPGQAVGDYEIVALLRHGRLGPIYRARERGLGHDVVIEEFLPPALAIRVDGLNVAPRTAATAEAFTHGRALLAEQARRLSGLHRAAFLARLVALVEANGTSYLVFDLATGLSLADRLKSDRRLEPAEALSLLQSLPEALGRLHEAGLIHGDIRPANIVLDMAGRPILVNFAGVQAALAGPLPPAALSAPDYSAPEQLTGGPPGPWSDIYGLGATLHAAITGDPPSDAITRLRADDYRPLAARRPAGFSVALLQAIDQALALGPDARPQSAMAWQAMLAKARTPQAPAAVALATMPLATAAARQPPSTSPLPGPGGRLERLMPGHRPGLRIGGAVAAVALLSFGAWLIAAHWSPDSVSAAEAGARPAPVDLAWQRHEAAAREAALRIVRQRQAQDRQAADDAEAELRKEDAARARERAAAQARAEAEVVRHRREVERRILDKLDADAAARRKAAAEREAAIELQAAATGAAVDAQQQADAADLDRARADEAALGLAPLDRQHVQVALNAIGFSVDGFDGTAGIDGDFGPLTRGAIAAWQKAEGDAATGFLTAIQERRLLRDNARVIADFDVMRDLPAAERNETALGLAPLDRQHVQVALAALGFDAGAADSLFGIRSRQMIAAWQTVHGEAPSGFLTADQVRRLLGDPAVGKAIAAFDATDPQLAQPREAALNLGVRDRRHVQVALQALGFATDGTDGMLGPQSRQAIAAWQKSRQKPASGYLDADTLRALLQEGGPAIAAFDEAQRKVVASTAGD